MKTQPTALASEPSAANPATEPATAGGVALTNGSGAEATPAAKMDAPSETKPLEIPKAEETAGEPKTEEEPKIEADKAKRPREEEEAADLEQEVKRPRKSSASSEIVDEEDSQGIRRSGRERKAVQREGFVSSPREGAGGEAAEEGEAVAHGQGVCLETISVFVSNYNSIKANNPCIRKLYKALFNTAGRPQTRRAEILKWSGIEKGGSSERLNSSLASACTVAELIDIGKKFLGLSTGAGGKVTKQAWCDAITEVLANPQPEKIHLASTTRVSESSYGGGGLRGRGPSGYQLFCSENREALKARHPDVSHREFLKILSQAWKEVPEEERQKYLGTANAKKAASPKRGVGGRRKRRGSSDEEEPEIEESEEDEEEEAQQSVEEAESSQMDTSAVAVPVSEEAQQAAVSS